MRIAIVGVGAVGGYFGGRLAQAGQDVHFLARGETLEALRTSGLRVQSIEGDFEVASPSASDDPAAIGPVDLVMLAVKAPQVRAVASQLKPLVGATTTILPLQNGLETPSILREFYPPETILGGLSKIFAARTAPAVIEHIGLHPVIELGEWDNRRTERVAAILDAFGTAAGMTAVNPENIDVAIWEKVLYVEPLGLVGAAVREPIGVVRMVPESRELLHAAMREIVALGIARGVPLDPNLAERAAARIDQLNPAQTASMHRDLNEGRRSELEAQTAPIVRYAKERGVATPVHDALYAALKPGDLRAHGELPT